MSRLNKGLQALLPGIFLIGYNIGTGSLTAMSKAGANFGTGLLWAVLLSCLITWYLINFFSRFTMATGMTAMEAYGKHIHPLYAWVLWTGLSIIILSALMAMMFVLSAAVMLTAAATLHVNGQKMNHIKEMISMLKPLFGSGALFVFAIGILAAGISSHLPNMMVIPWLSDDMRGVPRNTRTLPKRLVLSALTVISMLGVLMDRPAFLLLLSQAGISVVMPLALLGLMYLSSRKDILGPHRPSSIEWVLLGLIACFCLFMSSQAIRGLIKDFSSLL